MSDFETGVGETLVVQAPPQQYGRRATDLAPTRFGPRPAERWDIAVMYDEHLLRDLIVELRGGEKPPQLRQRELAEAAECTEAAIKRMLSRRDPVPLPPKERKKLLAYIIDIYPSLTNANADGEDTSDPAILRNVVLGMNKFLQVGHETRKHLQTRLSGLYWIYRRSVVDPSKFIRGLLAMWWIENERSNCEGMVRVCEVHRSQKEVKRGRCEAPELSETYDGFAIIKKNTLHIFISERYSRNDRGPLLISRFHHFIPSEPALPMQIARGWLPGAGDTGLALPVVLVRVQSTEALIPHRLLDYIRAKEKIVGTPSSQWPPRDLGPIEALYNHCDIVDCDEVPSMVLAQLEFMARENERRGSHGS